MVVSGLLSSWTMPAAIWPSCASLSDCISWARRSIWARSTARLLSTTVARIMATRSRRRDAGEPSTKRRSSSEAACSVAPCSMRKGITFSNPSSGKSRAGSAFSGVLARFVGETRRMTSCSSSPAPGSALLGMQIPMAASSRSSRATPRMSVAASTKGVSTRIWQLAARRRSSHSPGSLSRSALGTPGASEKVSGSLVTPSAAILRFRAGALLRTVGAVCRWSGRDRGSWPSRCRPWSRSA